MNKYFLVLLILLFFFNTINAETTRIMLLGDSITEDYRFSDDRNPRPIGLKNGYRNDLWYMLQDAKYDVDFVGTRKFGADIRPRFDIDNEGYSGITSLGIANGILPRLGTFAPHIIVLHIGTNDYSTSVVDVEKILENIDFYENMQNFPMTVVIARIINKTSYSSLISSFNSNLQIMLDRRIASGDDIVVVDMEHDAGLYYDTRDFADLLHPNDSGYHKMATVWFDALRNLLPSPIPTSPTYLMSSLVDTTEVTLLWNDTSPNEEGFEIYNGMTLIAVLPANTHNYKVTGLTSRQIYSFSVKAYNTNGTSNAVTFNVKTKDDYGWLIPIHNMLN